MIGKMAKGVKKTRRRMKKTVRKTLAALFLVSAIVVAAIPVDGLQARTTIANDPLGVRTAPSVKIDCTDVIPRIDAGTNIYTTGDQSFQFAYIEDNSNIPVAVIVGYGTLKLDNNTLTIPSTVDAYAQYRNNLGTTSGYVAVGKNGNFLFYREEVINHITVSGGDDYDEITYNYLPCYYDTLSEWNDIAQYNPELLYYDAASPNEYNEAGNQNYVACTDTTYQIIRNATVAYISDQYITKNTGDTHWYYAGDVTESTKEHGIFANNGNISKLIISDSLVGIGNYAFYNCGSLRSIDLYESNGLKIIGSGAFSGCYNMTSITLNVENNLAEIGDYAFYNCQSLESFVLPINVTAIGDSAFEGCESLKTIDLCSENSRNALTTLGRDVFKNCAALQSITFPYMVTGDVYISQFQGCRALQYISTKNINITFPEEPGIFGYDDFKEMLSGEPVYGTFYFEGTGDSKVHELTIENCFAFRYLTYLFEPEDLYELTVQEIGTGESGRATYQTNSAHELTSCITGSDVHTFTIPGQIGPISVYNIGSTTFRNHCSLETVVIPANIQNIADYAFAGCHNLRNVVFESPDVVIGDYAFQTQYVTTHETSCTNADSMTNSNGDPKVELFFSGEITSNTVVSGPYEYAMSYEGRYNNTAQNPSFIKFYSDWPNNLVVQYRYDSMSGTGYSELVDFPALSDLGTGGKLLEEYNNGARAYLKDYVDVLKTESLSEIMTAYASNNYTELSENQINLLKAILKIEVPAGVESIKDGLLYSKEEADSDTYRVEREFVLFGVETLSAANPDDPTDPDSPLDPLSLETIYKNSDFEGSETLTGITIYGNTRVPDYAFANCANLANVEIAGDTPSIGNYAFENNPKLENVTISGTTSSIGSYAFKNDVLLKNVSISDSVSNLGTVPFINCEVLTDVNFVGSPYYTTDTSIIYELKNGEKSKIVECLKGRSSKYVRANELSTVKDIDAEAFNNTEVVEVDLSESSIGSVPSYAFAYTPKLRTVKLPATCTTIYDNAFFESAMDTLEATQYLTLISQEAFAGLTNTPPNSNVTFCAPTDSYLYNYGTLYGYSVETTASVNHYTVVFWDWDEELQTNVEVDSQYIKEGEDAQPPTPRGKEGYVFKEWNPSYKEVSADMWCFAQYVTPSDDYNKFTVIFQDYDGTELKKVYVSEGEDASAFAPKDPEREGYVFIGWDRVLTDVKENITTMAKYEEKGTGHTVRYFDKSDNLIYTTTVEDGQNAPNISAPEVSGYKFTGWRPSVENITKDTDVYAQYEAVSSGSGNSGNSGNNGSSGGDNSNNPGQSTAVTYTLTVVNGSGSGSYVAGSQPIIVCNEPAKGLEFSNWTIDPSDTKIASTAMTATVITMPSKNVTVTAHYKSKSSSSSSGNSQSGSTVSGNNQGANSPGSGTGNSGTISNSGTTVVIDKNGLSNTGVVSATIKGSSDNFTIKITESSSASEEILKALKAEYGDNISNVKYFPMDISLYDSKGTNKITDTTGLSIAITLPLPDSLITYAGNNKVAGVVNGKLDKLDAKFTTIDGVACVTFKAEHFSPYVIYVDTMNLTAGTNNDETPKTGDGIHPKWFLSLGLACVSIFLFLKKDKRRVNRVIA